MRLLQHNLPLADATVGAATQHDAWCGAGVGRIFDDDDAVDDDGGTRAARIAVRVRVSRLVTEVVRVKNRDVGRKTLCALSPELRRRYDPGAFPDARNYGRRHRETYAPQASQPNPLAASPARLLSHRLGRSFRHVRFAPIATNLLHASKTTLSAITGREQMQQSSGRSQRPVRSDWFCRS